MTLALIVGVMLLCACLAMSCCASCGRRSREEEPIGMFRVARSRAGRSLSGVEHNGYPPLPAHFTKEAAE
uniref:Secreted protein n=1 Tax=Rhizobium leguminosarum bv. trifolii TaxID=386 RepID=A0A1C9I141_RHILT|nr:hypothetical protein [Rhizobium leguminosarum bv. trifolii]